LKLAYRKVHRAMREGLAKLGWNLYPTRDFYSPLPVFSEVEKTRHLWDRPSEMVGVRYDLDAMQERLEGLASRFSGEYAELPSYDEIKRRGLGPGFTVIDGMLLYMMIRELRPRRYVEIGSGFSTYYSWLAVERSRREGAACDFGVVDPFPRARLRELSGIEVRPQIVQEVPLDYFERLEAGDVLFIDTTHVLKLGGDVAYLFLEIVPRVAPGVVIHVHDIHFPFNVPYPAEQYVFRTEAMLLQAFLAYNSDFEILLSAPLLRFHREAVLAAALPGYRPVEVGDYDTHFGSIWLRRVR
jgi:predicted O-methyltransferase YrrM